MFPLAAYIAFRTGSRVGGVSEVWNGPYALSGVLAIPWPARDHLFPLPLSWLLDGSRKRINVTFPRTGLS